MSAQSQRVSKGEGPCQDDVLPAWPVGIRGLVRAGAGPSERSRPKAVISTADTGPTDLAVRSRRLGTERGNFPILRMSQEVFL
jgi:hypothetical protein